MGGKKKQRTKWRKLSLGKWHTLLFEEGVNRTAVADATRGQDKVISWSPFRRFSVRPHLAESGAPFLFLFYFSVFSSYIGIVHGGDVSFWLCFFFSIKIALGGTAV